MSNNLDDFFGKENEISYENRKKNLKCFDVDSEISCYKNCPENNTDWAEIKTSIFVKKLLERKDTNDIMTDFLHDIHMRIINYLDTVKHGDDGDNSLFRLYLVYRSNNSPGTRDYPVGIPNDYPIHDINDIKNNFYAYYNYLKWLWVVFSKSDPYNTLFEEYPEAGNQNNANDIFLIIQFFQQPVNNLIGFGRGLDRFDQEMKHREISPQVGITNVNVPYLSQRSEAKEGWYWQHPGKVACLFPYVGTYSKFMEREQGSPYGSFLCGISGSSQYTTFLYFFSLLSRDMNTNIDYNEEFTKLLLTSVSVLAGDGGHNIREVLSGITITQIGMRNVIRQFDNRENNIFIENKIQEILYMIGNEEYPQTIINIFEFCINKFRPAVNNFYENTRYINILNVFENELKMIYQNVYGTDINLTDEKFKDEILTEILNLVTYQSNELAKMLRYKMLHIAFALDGDRYRLDPNTSFKETVNIRINNFLEINPDLKEDIDTELKRVKLQCMVSDIKFA